MIRKNTKRFITAAGIALLLSAVPACGEDSSTSDPAADAYVENEWNYVDGSMDISGGIPADASGRLAVIRENGCLTVATEPYYAPQEFIDPSLEGDAQYVGADIELAKRIAERMGVELVLVPLDFTDVLDETAAGTYDLAISGLAYTPGRSVRLTLSKGYHFSTEGSTTGILIRESDADKIKRTEDLRGRNIAAQSGSLQEAMMAEHVREYHQFRRLPQVPEIYAALHSGEIDAAAVDVETALLYIESNPDAGLMLLPDVTFALDEVLQGDRVAAKKGETELMYFVNGVIDEILASGEYEDWFTSFSEYAARLGL